MRRLPRANLVLWAARSPVVGFVLLAAGCASVPSGPTAPAPAPAATPPAAQAAGSPDANSTAAVATDCGYRLVVNSGAVHYTVDVVGTSLRSEKKDDALAFLVDDLVVQIVDTTRAQIGPAAAGKTGIDLLRAHEAWEGNYLAKQLGVSARPIDIAIQSGKDGTFPDGVLTWWLPLPDLKQEGVTTRRSWSFVTAVLGDQVVGLSALAEQGLEPLDVVTRLATWMKTVKPSPSVLSVQAVSAAIKAQPPVGECPAITPRGVTGIDRRLRLDGIPRAETDRLARFALKQGGVERQQVGERLRYRNHVCRFEMTYPDDGWSDFEIQDVSSRGCSANVATPLLDDKDTHEKITNAVALTATQASADFGPSQLQEGIVAAVKSKGAVVKPAKKPLIDGASQVSYTADADGTHFTGEILTVRRGEMLYNVHFNSTRGTVDEGRKHLAKFLGGLRLDVR